MKTKLSILEEHMAAGRYDDAIRVAAKFPRLGDHEAQIRRAASAVVSPDMYTQMGYDVAQIRQDAIAAINERYEWKY